MKRNVAVILPAAGSGKRFGGRRPKQFLDLQGVPVIERTVGFFSRHPRVAQIVIASQPDAIAGLNKLATRFPRVPPIRVVTGGATRQDSVEQALEAVESTCDWVAVHDVVRPLLDARLFGALLKAAAAGGAAVPGLLVTDTLKRLDAGGWVAETVSRDQFVAVQTPQVFGTEILRKAFRRAAQDGFQGTDEAMLVERAGTRVIVVPGARWNIKLTLPGDLELAEWYLSRAKERQR